MENEHHPQMAEIAEAAHRLRLVVGWQQQQFAATVFDQPRLAGNGEFFFIRRADHADLLENEFGHLDETLSAEPWQTACW